MKRLVALGACALASVVLVGGSAFAQGKGRRSSSSHSGHVQVRSYTTKKGTYVQSHHRSKADGSFSNNWSTKGNINPDTGKRGTKTHR
ncbi:MAG: hypothetical protein QM758_13345 [Armatimonas sp.]